MSHAWSAAKKGETVMDEKFSKFLTTEYKMGKLMIAPIDLLLLLATVAFGILFRSKVFCIVYPGQDPKAPMASYDVFLKVFGSCFDLVLAVLCGTYTGLITGRKLRGYLIYALTFLLPVMVMSSCMFKTGDSVYLSLLVLFLILEHFRKKVPAAAAYLAAVLLQPYALLLLPALPVLTGGGEKSNGRKGEAFLLPAASALAGVLSCFLRYGMQTGFFLVQSQQVLDTVRGERLLSYNAPNLYQLLGPDAFVSEYTKAGIALTLIVSICYLFWTAGMAKTGEKYSMGAKLFTAYASCMLLSFIMPGMCERSGYVGMLLSVFFVMLYPKYCYHAIAQVILCFMAGAAFFREGGWFHPPAYAALFQLLLILDLFCRIKKEIFATEEVL